MKHLLFILLLGLIGYNTTAQPAGSLQIVNNTSCTVFYRIFGGPPAACNGTGGGPVVSTLIAALPFANFVYPNAASIPGFPGGGGNFIFGAWPHFGTNMCSTNFRRLGQPCSGLTLTNPPYPLYTSSCLVCNPAVTPVWTPTGFGGMAVLTFN